MSSILDIKHVGDRLEQVHLSQNVSPISEQTEIPPQLIDEPTQSVSSQMLPSLSIHQPNIQACLREEQELQKQPLTHSDFIESLKSFMLYVERSNNRNPGELQQTKEASEIVAEQADYFLNQKKFPIDLQDTYLIAEAAARVWFRVEGNPTKALPYALKACEICDKPEFRDVNGENFSFSHNDLAHIYAKLEKTNDALKNYLLSKENGEKHLNSPNQLRSYITALHGIGNCQLKEEEALRYHLEALKFINRIKKFNPKQNALSIAYGNIARALRLLGNYSKAAYYFEQMYEVRYSLDRSFSDPRTAAALNELGSIYQELGQYTKAHQYCLQALQMTQGKHG